MHFLPNYCYYIIKKKKLCLPHFVAYHRFFNSLRKIKKFVICVHLTICSILVLLIPDQGLTHVYTKEKKINIDFQNTPLLSRKPKRIFFFFVLD